MRKKDNVNTKSFLKMPSYKDPLFDISTETT